MVWLRLQGCMEGGGDVGFELRSKEAQGLGLRVEGGSGDVGRR